MKKAALISAVLVALAASAASAAACTVEYKAKRDKPLRLDHGMITVQDAACTKSSVRDEVQKQLAAQGWTLLSILSVSKDG